MSSSENRFSGFRIFWEHNRVFSLLCFWTYACCLAGALLSHRLRQPLVTWDMTDSFWNAWLSWLIPTSIYLLLQVGSAFFLLGPFVSFLLEGAACFFLGYVGLSTVYVCGWLGVLLQAGVSFLSALLFVPLTLHAAASIRLSRMMRANLFGSDRGLLYPAEIKLYGIRSLVTFGAAVLFSACAGAWCYLF